MPRFQGVWLINRELDGVHYVPDDPQVLKSFEVRGWEKTDLPDLDDDDPEFIEALANLKAEDSKAAKSKKSAEAKPATKEEEVK